MTRTEIIELIVQERLSLYFKENLEHGRAEVKRSDEFLALLKEKAPELAEEFQKYLNWLAEHGGDEQEGIYLKKHIKSIYTVSIQEAAEAGKF